MTFGLAHITAEGAPLHPDDIDCDLSEEEYARQEEAYNKFFSEDGQQIGEN